MAHKKLGEILMERGLLDEDQLTVALAYQRQWGHRLGVAMVAKGFISEGMLTKVLSESLGVAMVDLSTLHIPPEVLQMLPVGLCEAQDLLPIHLKVDKGRRQLAVAMSDPLNVAAIEEIEFTVNAAVRPVLAQISSINQAIRRYYHGDRVQISPLQLTKAAGSRNTETMTLLRDGGTEEVIELRPEDQIADVDPAAPVSGDQFSAVMSDLDNARRLALQGASVSHIDLERIDALERKFWALMRSLARKGLITKEEFLDELERSA